MSGISLRFAAITLALVAAAVTGVMAIAPPVVPWSGPLGGAEAGSAGVIATLKLGASMDWGQVVLQNGADEPVRIEEVTLEQGRSPARVELLAARVVEPRGTLGGGAFPSGTGIERWGVEPVLATGAEVEPHSEYADGIGPILLLTIAPTRNQMSWFKGVHVTYRSDWFRYYRYYPQYVLYCPQYADEAECAERKNL